MSAQRLRDRLQKLTNSDVITINDREFTDRICQLLEDKQKVNILQHDTRDTELLRFKLFSSNKL